MEPRALATIEINPEFTWFRFAFVGDIVGIFFLLLQLQRHTFSYIGLIRAPSPSTRHPESDVMELIKFVLYQIVAVWLSMNYSCFTNVVLFIQVVSWRPLQMRIRSLYRPLGPLSPICMRLWGNFVIRLYILANRYVRLLEMLIFV